MKCTWAARRSAMPIENNLPGAAYPNVLANKDQLDESGFKTLAVPKSEM